MATLNLSPLDVAVLIGFLLAMLALGFSAKLRDASVFQFLTAGRRLTLPAFVATLVSTWYGGILGIGESAAYYGLGTWLLMGAPYYVFGLIYARWYAKRAREAPQISIPEMLANRFGRPMGLVGAGLIFLLALPAAHALMMGVLIQATTGWDITWSVVVAMAIGAALLVKGGLLADVRMAIPAFLMMYVGFAAILIWCLSQYPPAQTFAELQKSPLWSFDGGQGVIPVITFFILGAWTLVDPGFHQRVASVESPEMAQKGVIASVLCWMVFDALSIGTALYALAIGVQTAGGGGPGNPLLIFPAMAEQVLPPGLKAVFLCGMLGTIASAMVSYTLVSGATFGREFVGRLRPEWADEKIGLWTRVGIGITCVLAAAVGLSVQSVVSLWYAWAGAVVGALLIPVSSAYGLFRLRLKGGAVAFISAIAAAVSLGWMMYGIRTDNPFLNVTIGESTFGLGTLIPGLIVSVIGLGIGHLASPKSAE